MVELYTMQQFLDPGGLRERGIEHFDAWAATFGEVVENLEVSPDGKTLRPRSRFARFTNLPELQQMFRSFADVQTAEMLDLPRPRLAGDKPTVVACPMSDVQRALQERLVARYERLRTQKIDPREDNALAITTDGRKLALDARLLVGAATEHPGSKINALVDQVCAIYERTGENAGTQLIFSDLGVHPTPWGYSVYEDIATKLVARGIPRQRVAAIGDADNDAKKQSLFERVRNGVVRVLIGSTTKLGTGTNVQRKLVALHHLDAPWKPAEVEQREGRILRQGNENAEVGIYRYVTEGSFDSFMWQALETKARFIAQVMTGDCGVRRSEDIGGQELSYAEVKAIASGNPAVFTLAEADAALQRLSTLGKLHADEQFLARRKLRELPETVASLAKLLGEIGADMETAREHAEDAIVVGERECSREDVIAILGNRLGALPDHVEKSTSATLGRIRGLEFGLIQHPYGAPEVSLGNASRRLATLSRESHGPRAVLNALERLLSTYEAHREGIGDKLAIAQGQLRDYEARIGIRFSYDEDMKELAMLRDQLRRALSVTIGEAGSETPTSIEEITRRIKALLAKTQVESSPLQRPGLALAAAIRPRGPATQPPLAPDATPDPNIHVPATPASDSARLEADAVSPVRPEPAPPIQRREKYQKWLF